MSQNILNQVQQFRCEIRTKKLQNILNKKRATTQNQQQYDNDFILAQLINELHQQQQSFENILFYLSQLNVQELTEDMIQIFNNLIQKNNLEINLEIIKIIANYTFQCENINEYIIFLINELYFNNQDQQIQDLCILSFGNLCYESEKACEQLQNIFIHFLQKIDQIQSVETYGMLIWLFVCASKYKIKKQIKNGFITAFLKAIFQQIDETILKHAFEGLKNLTNATQYVQSIIDFDICFKTFQLFHIESCQSLVLQMVKFSNSNQIQNLIEDGILDQLMNHLENAKILEIMTYMFAQDINYNNKLFNHPIWNLYIEQLKNEFQIKRLVLEGLYYLASNGDDQTIFQIINQDIHYHFQQLYEYQDMKINTWLKELIQMFIQTDKNYQTKLELINFMECYEQIIYYD